MDLGLSGKVILVAGSSRGIGKAIAATLIEEGARVCISGRDPDSLAEAQRELSARGPVLAFEGDLSSPDAIAAAFERIHDQWGTLDGLVCNLGTGSGSPGWNQSEDDWERLFRLNFQASARLAQGAIPRLDRGGSIVFISSITGVEATPAPLPYSAAKAAIIGFTNSVARSVGPYRIRVNAIAPGMVLTPRQRELWIDADREQQMLASQCLPDAIDPVDIAAAALFLCSNAGRAITKQCVTINAGSL